jgi:hypothetical protein
MKNKIKIKSVVVLGGHVFKLSACMWICWRP